MDYIALLKHYEYLDTIGVQNVRIKYSTNIRINKMF